MVKHANLIAAVDVGSSKTVCLIAKCDSKAQPTEENAARSLRIVGFGETETQGMRRGTVTDMHAVEMTVRKVLDQAEAHLGDSVDRVVISACAGAPETRLHSVSRDLGRPITERDIELLAERAVREFDRRGRYIMHAIPACFTVDGMAGITNLQDMRADNLTMDMLFVTADLPPLKNLGVCIEKCHVELGGRVLTPYASGLSSLLPDEKNSGALCIDMGADVTSSVVFLGGRPVYANTLRLGGSDISRDIAGIFMTPLSAAESVKKRSGAAVRWSVDERETVDLPVLSDDDTYPVLTKVPRARLNDVIRPRLEEIFENIRDHARACGAEAAAGGRIILTGGGAQLTGVLDVAAAVFDRRPRLATPVHIPDMPETKRTGAYAAAVGLLLYAACPPEEVLPEVLMRTDAAINGNKLRRMVAWVKEHF